MSDHRNSELPNITAIGEVAVDHIFIKKNHKLRYIGSTGGGSSSNTICYLAALRNTTKIIGVVGDDNNARIALKDFERFEVNIDGLIIEKGHTTTQIAHIIFLNSKKDHSFSLTCPKCKLQFWTPLPFRRSHIGNAQKEILRKSNLIILDGVSETYLELAKSAYKHNIPIIIDLGTTSKHFFKAEDVKSILKLGTIIQLPEESNQLFLEKLNINSYWQINPNLTGVILTTNGELLNSSLYERKTERIYNLKTKIDTIKLPLDSGGAGDTFLAFFINAIKQKTNNFSTIGDLSALRWEQAIKIAHLAASESCQYIGSRGFLYSKFIKDNSTKVKKADLIKEFGESLTTFCVCSI